MSENKLAKNCRTECSSSKGLSWTPIIISDSKGRYLKEFSKQRDIVWICKGGWTSSDIFTFIHKNLRKLLRKHNKISLYIWVGTCDFTEKIRRFVYLRNKQQDVMQRLCNNLQGIKDICVSSKIKLTFLQCPFYSIQIWNSYKGHPNSESFKSDDQFLTAQINSLNDFIQDLNVSLNSYTPKLNQDLLRSRKGSGKKQRYSVNLKLLKDGIHPDKALARSWFTSIYRKIQKDCI